MEANNSGNLLMELPEEIVEMVLRHLDPDARVEAVLVCQAFYEHICRLEKDSRALMINYKLLDDDIFNSMMSSKRRISRITVNDEDSKVEFKKIIAVVEKFKRDTKTLNVKGFSQFTRENYYELLNTASEVVNLALSETGRFKDGPRRFVPLNKFKKLKQLWVFGCSEVNMILDAILDDSLEKLLIRGSTKGLTDQNLQAFLNRQSRIVEFNVTLGHTINLEHHVLEELTFMETVNPRQRENMIKLLKTQSMLRSLKTREVTSEEFSQICEMRNLEKLFVHIDNVAAESIGALQNLQKLVELELWYCSRYSLDLKLLALSQIQLPALQKLSLSILEGLKPEHLAAMGRNFSNIQHLDVKYVRPDLLAIIIDEFAALKTLQVYLTGNEENYARPNHQNLTLEELKIHKINGIPSMENIGLLINACPNLKRLQLLGLPITDDLILEIINQHSRLTHLSTSILVTVKVRNEFEPEASWLLKIIDIFRRSPHFISLQLGGLPNLNQQLVHETKLIGNITATISKSDGIIKSFIFARNSSTRDPYKNFAL